MDIQQEIIKLLEGIDREGIDKVIKFLRESDYFTSPASTKGHMSVPGGLAIHSYITYKVLKDLIEQSGIKVNRDSIILIALLHDICKVGCYESNTLKNGKVSESKPYVFNDRFPIGHGDKSVIILQNLIELTEEEMMAIRYHQGVFTFNDVQQWNIVKSMIDKSGFRLLTYATHVADMFASNVVEWDEGAIRKYIL
jgi:hypothetical protein